MLSLKLVNLFICVSFRYIVCVMMCLTLLCGSSSAGEGWKTKINSVLKKHCLDCHTGKDAEAGIDLSTLSGELSNKDVLLQWVRVHDKVKSGEMPPKDEESLTNADQSKLLTVLSVEMTKEEILTKEVVLRRLNRVEYENTIRDLFGINVDLKEMLLEDSKAHGFDNVGSALSSSAELVGIYLNTADVALDKVFGPAKKPRQIKLAFNLKDHPRIQGGAGRLFRKTDDGIVLFNPRGQRIAQFWELIKTRKNAGTYRVKMKVSTFQSKKPIALHVYGGDVLVGIKPHYIVGYYDIPPNKPTVIEFEAYLEKGGSFAVVPYYNTFTFKRFKQTKGGARIIRSKPDTFPGEGLLIGDIELEGPLEQWPPLSYKKLMGNTDLKRATLSDAERIIVKFLPRAYRRKIKPNEVKPYLKLVKHALDEKRSFKDALRLGLKAILCSPEFLFLEEPGREKINDDALASRLSYFLWSSMPDDELFQLASQGKLNNPKELRNQVERMLRNPKSKAFTDNFTGQWLALREIDFTEPDKKLYPEFDEPLKVAMIQETHHFFQEVLDKDLNLMNFIDSDFIMINERLARHYGIKDVQGQKIRKVALPKNHVRGGMLTQASVMKVTANGTSTSPVLRGVWILENIIGLPSSPPPPTVSTIEPDTRGATTLREQLAKHRNVKSCAVCHVKIDPPGFALESFDVIGGYRNNYRSMVKGERVNIYIDKYAGVRTAYRTGLPVDASGQTSDRKPFKDILEFKKLLMREKYQVTKNLAEKLLIYSTGRGLGFSDRPTVENLITTVSKNDYGFRTLVYEVVQTELFRRP